MTKQDFKLFAQFIKKLELKTEPIEIVEVERGLIEVLEELNPRFNRLKWLKFKNGLSR